MTTENKLLEKLLERETKLKAEIKKAKRAEEKRLANIHAEKCRALGAAIFAEIETKPELFDTLRPILDKHTTSKKYRLMLGLDAEKKQADTSTQEPEKNPLTRDNEALTG